jgi:hypothetical protein
MITIGLLFLFFSFLFFFIMGGPRSFVKLFGPTQAIKIYLDFDIIENPPIVNTLVQATTQLPKFLGLLV